MRLKTVSKLGLISLFIALCLLTLFVFIKFPWIFENEAAPGVKGPHIPIIIDQLGQDGRVAKPYLENCAYCHERGVGPNLREKSYTASVLNVFVRNGTGAMPAIPATHLSDEELEKIAAYLDASGGEL